MNDGTGIVFGLTIDSRISPEAFVPEELQAILPSHYEVRKSGNQFCIFVKAKDKEFDGIEGKLKVDQEFDRYFFFTGIRIQAHKVIQGFSNVATCSFRTLGIMPEGAGPQNWYNDLLPTQLRLWAIALDNENEVFRALMFFQIIELRYPSKECYPYYEDPSKEPDPLTECKLFRNWVTHAGNVHHGQLKKYCAHLKTAERMYNPRHKYSYTFFYEKIHLLESQAKKIIEELINFDG